jgi:hypothetical protein
MSLPRRRILHRHIFRTLKNFHPSPPELMSKRELVGAIHESPLLFWPGLPPVNPSLRDKLILTNSHPPRQYKVAPPSISGPEAEKIMEGGSGNYDTMAYF